MNYSTELHRQILLHPSFQCFGEFGNRLSEEFTVDLKVDVICAGFSVMSRRCAVVSAAVTQRHVVNSQVAVDNTTTNHRNSHVCVRRALRNHTVAMIPTCHYHTYGRPTVGRMWLFAVIVRTINICFCFYMGINKFSLLDPQYIVPHNYPAHRSNMSNTHMAAARLLCFAVAYD